MKRIVIFCDGTWNSRDARQKTSIARVSELAEQQATAKLKVHYEPGLGTESDKTGLAARWDKLRGGALGRGLTQNIHDCLAYLIEHYEPDDRIYIFGFSRGAYTARSLAGLLRNCGVPKRLDDAEDAMSWYRRRDEAAKPDTEPSWRLRLRLNPEVHTSADEAAWRAAQGHAPGKHLQIAYLGIFDTVGAHGVGGVLGQFRSVPGGHGFHDHELSHLVQSGWHALALDETRVLYRPTQWSNLDRLNRDAGPDATAGARYRQLWFPGSHGKVGGSGKDRALSNRVLAWIMTGAEIAGLKLDLTAEPDLALHDGDHRGPLHNETDGLDLTAVVQWARRGPGAGEADLLHPVAQWRIAEDYRYRPASLRHLLLHPPSLAAVQAARPSRFA